MFWLGVYFWPADAAQLSDACCLYNIPHNIERKGDLYYIVQL